MKTHIKIISYLLLLSSNAGLLYCGGGFEDELVEIKKEENHYPTPFKKQQTPVYPTNKTFTLVELKTKEKNNNDGLVKQIIKDAIEVGSGVAAMELVVSTVLERNDGEQAINRGISYGVGFSLGKNLLPTLLQNKKQ